MVPDGQTVVQSPQPWHRFGLMSNWRFSERIAPVSHTSMQMLFGLFRFLSTSDLIGPIGL